MPQPRLSAWILDRAVSALPPLAAAQGYCLATEELGLGQPLAARPLDLCFGLASVEPRQATNRLAAFVLGRGLARVGGGAPAPLLSPPEVEIPYGVDALLGAAPASDAFAFGSVFLVAYTASGAGPFVDARASLLRGGASQGGAPLMVQRTLSASSVAEMHAQARLGTPLPSWNASEGDRVAVELFRFVLDIDAFVYQTPEKTQVATLVDDRRLQRGWGGYADDALARTLLPALIDGVGALGSASAQVGAQVYKLVSEWVGLSCWAPDFVGFWSDPSNAPFMRPALKAYLGSVLQIQLP